MGSAFLPTRELLRDIAEALDCEPNDQAVTAAFDQLVLRGQLVPFVPDWWELMGWLPSELERMLQGPSWGPVWGPRSGPYR